MKKTSVQNAFLIIDIGTGNVRVALVSSAGKILSVERENVQYKQDDRYPEALYFDPDRLWNQIIKLGQKTIRQNQNVTVQAITASSQREGIVLLDAEGNSLIGLPNHDHRGRQWQNTVENKDHIYELTGRYPTSLFSALKLRGIKEKRTRIWEKLDSFLSISDWAQYQLSGVARYEYSQASETQLYDVAQKKWAQSLESFFDINVSTWPELVSTGTVLGDVLPEYAAKWNISAETPIVVGGADTQLAIKSTQPGVGDIVIVAGTTTPVTKVLDSYQTDTQKRTWTSCDIEENRFILETNAGVTGLNYQRLKDIFYPNEEYQTIEKEIKGMTHSKCIASLGSLLAGEKKPLVRGGFVFNVPVSHQLSRADFAWATLWDIACSVKENYESLCEVSSHNVDYVWVCGGGIQSPALRQFISNLIGKELRIRTGYRQASVAGAALICSEALGNDLASEESALEKVIPQNKQQYERHYQEWKNARTAWREFG